MSSEFAKPSPDNKIPEPPTGWSRLVWLGPGFLWMVSTAGSGELLFTPRVAAQYGYALVWAMLAAVTLKWFINREVGRPEQIVGSLHLTRRFLLASVCTCYIF